MDDEYREVIRTKLNLKGTKRKKRILDGLTSDDSNNSSVLKDNPSFLESQNTSSPSMATSTKLKKTPAELEYEVKRKAAQEREIRKSASKSYRKRIEEYNQALAALSEHHDIPKVGPG